MPGYTERAVGEFLSTGTRVPRRLVWAMGLVKYAAARANLDLGLLDEARARAIMEVALELAEGRYDDRIIVDVFQTGSGTGLNMNVNEVIAEEATKRAGVTVHPNDHVNMGQSSNDTVPTAVRVAAVAGALEAAREVESLAKALARLAEREKNTVKPGRTHLRDALPVTLGMELEAWAEALLAGSKAIVQAARRAALVPLGGTAVGTGLNAHPAYPEKAVRYLAEASGLDLLRPSPVKAWQMRSISDLVALSGTLKAVALDLWRFNQDVRLMFSGPNTGIGEVDLPQRIPGSSMMPGKVNPVTSEAVMQAASHVVGLDQSLTQAALLGEFELGMGFPLAGYVLDRITLLVAEAARKTRDNVVARIEPRRERMRALAEKSQALVTVLAPVVGYEEAARISRMIGEGKSIREALVELGYDEEWISRVLDLERLTRPGIPVREVDSGK